MQTYQPKKEDVKRNWYLFDAKGKVLGRLASQIARLLQGKHKVTYAAHVDCGDCVVVINAKDVVLTGKKEKQKVYYRHSGYLGNLKTIPVAKLRAERPERIIELAVSGMLPQNRLKKDRMRRLKVFAGVEHPYKETYFKTNSIKN